MSLEIARPGRQGSLMRAGFSKSTIAPFGAPAPSKAGEGNMKVVSVSPLGSVPLRLSATRLQAVLVDVVLVLADVVVVSVVSNI